VGNDTDEFAWRTQIGEAFVGEGGDAAHLNTVLGRRGGPVEVAWTTALATPRAGHVPFVVVLRPNLPVQPPTLFVNEAPLAGARHEALSWGAAQAGVAGGVADAVATGVVPGDAVGGLLLIAAVWVSPAAADQDAVYANNRDATLEALRAGAAGGPSVSDVLNGRDGPRNPYFAGPR
jgi:5,6,7,8-tetrahydromethanopterin hydro-lyase